MLLLLILGARMSGGAEAARTYTVGDYGGWKFNVRGWARGKTFRAGDVLGEFSQTLSDTTRPRP